MSRESISRTAASILAAFSLSIGTAAIAISKTSKYSHPHPHHSQADQQLVAGFPFRKKKDEAKSNAPKDANSTSPAPKSDANSNANADAVKSDAKADENVGGTATRGSQASSSESKSSASSDADKESKPSANSSADNESKPPVTTTEHKTTPEKNESNDKDSNKKEEDEKAQRKSDAKKARADEKAAAKAREAQEDAEKDAAKAAKKEEKKKQKDDKQKLEDAAAKQAEETKSKAKQDEAKQDKAKQDKVKQDKVKQDKAQRDKAAQDKAKQDESKQDEAKRQQEAKQIERSSQQRQVSEPRTSNSGYTADGALLSLLKDLARSLKDPAEQSKLGDENQKFVVQMALEVLNKALENRNDANRIVDPKTIAESSMSAEAWSSGDVKVSDQCRGSLAAVWAKKENGLLNVTIAGACKDKVAPSGKTVGEYVVILSARSAVQKGFDIQSQGDVNFWLAKLSSVSVDAACCSNVSSSDDKTSSSDAGDTRELKKNSTVVLQAIMTERERLFNDQHDATPKEQSSTTAQAQQPAKNVSDAVEQARKEREVLAAAQADQARKDKEALAAAQADQARKEKESKKAAAEKQRQLDEESKRVEAEKKQKQKEEEKRLEAENKRKLEEEDRKAEAAIKKRLDEDDRRAEAEERQKKEEKIRLAQAEKLRKASGKQQKIEQKQLKADEKDRQNSRMTRDDVILAEAARQVELEQTQGTSAIDPSANQMSAEQMTRADAILAEATRQAEAERREAADMRMPYGSSNLENNAIMPPVEIDNQQTALRPTPRISDLISSADLADTQSTAPSSDVRSYNTSGASSSGASSSSASSSGASSSSAIASNSDDSTSHRAMEYPTPPIEAQNNAATTLIADREAAKGWDSPGLPANVKEPSSGSHMVLPGRAIAGQHITASVIDTNHNGESGVELGFNGVNLATDAHGQVTFMVPEDAVPGNSLAVSMVGKSQAKPSQIEVLQPLTTSSQQEVPSIERASNMVSSNGTIVIDGHNFDGIADHNKVMIDENTECKVTAASPVQLRATVPASLSPGVHFATVRLKEAKSNPGRFNLVNAEVRPDPREADREQESKLVVKILGTTDRVQVHLTNETPDVIKISKGNDLRLTTSGGDDNSITVPVQRLRKGSYRVDAVIE